MKKIFIVKYFLIGLCLMSWCVLSVHANKKVKLRIIETTDLHGCFFPYDMMNNKPAEGSLSRVAHLVDSLRQEYGERLIVVDNGDILQGQPTVYWANYMDTLGVHLNAEMLNFIQYDAVTVGNHDIETGHAVYDRWVSQLNCPALGANVINTKTNTSYFKPYTILNRDGVKLCIFGMMTSAIPAWLPHKLWSDMRFDSMVETAKKWMPRILEEEKPDVVIGLFHSGSDGGIHNNMYVENEVKAVAKQVPGFDAIFFGHDHRKQLIKVKNNQRQTVQLINPAARGKYVGNLEIVVELEENKMVDKTLKSSLVDIRFLSNDVCFMERFSKDMQLVKDFVNQRVGTFTSDLNAKQVLWGSSSYVDFIHELQFKITGADVSITAPQSLSNIISAGPVYMRDMFSYVRYENFLYTMNLSGQEIRDELEYSYNLWISTMKTPNDHLILLKEGSEKELKNFSFNFDSAAGIDYEVDVRKPFGQRVKVLQFSDGRPFKLGAVYTVAISSYRGNGGGELLTKGSGLTKTELSRRLVKTTNKDLRYYLIQYLLSNTKVSPRAYKNWGFVPEIWTKAAAKRDSIAYYK